MSGGETCALSETFQHFSVLLVLLLSLIFQNFQIAQNRALLRLPHAFPAYRFSLNDKSHHMGLSSPTPWDLFQAFFTTAKYMKINVKIALSRARARARDIF